VYHEYESLDSNWTTQDTITVKFRNRLNKKAIAVIHENLLNTAEVFNHLRLHLWKEGILPGMKFVYGELYFDSSDTVYQEYLESDDVGYVYRIDEEGKVIFLHNVVWERAHGPIPRGYQVYHINGNTLDNRRENLDIMKIKDVFNLGEYETEIEAAQAYNIGALITEGPSAELNDVPPPTFDTYEKVLSMLKNQGWTANDTEISQLKTLLREKLGMQL